MHKTAAEEVSSYWEKVAEEKTAAKVPPQFLANIKSKAKGAAGKAATKVKSLASGADKAVKGNPYKFMGAAGVAGAGAGAASHAAASDKEKKAYYITDEEAAIVAQLREQQ